MEKEKWTLKIFDEEQETKIIKLNDGETFENVFSGNYRYGVGTLLKLAFHHKELEEVLNVNFEGR